MDYDDEFNPPVTVHYERLVNMGNYENIKIGIELQVPATEANEAMENARIFVHDQINKTLAGIRGTMTGPGEGDPFN